MAKTPHQRLIDRSFQACSYHATKAFWGHSTPDMKFLPPWDKLAAELEALDAMTDPPLEKLVDLSARMVKAGGSRKEHQRLLAAATLTSD